MRKNKKAIIIGPPLVGKTTLVNYLREHTNFLILELDEELFKLNNGTWPADEEYRNKVLVHKVVDDIKIMDKVIFFTTYFSIDDLKKAKENKFKIIQLMLDKSELIKRNAERMQNKGELDAAEALKENLKLQDDINNAGVFDKIIYTNKPVEDIASEIINFLE